MPPDTSECNWTRHQLITPFDVLYVQDTMVAEVGDWVAAIHMDAWYIGCVVNVGIEAAEVQIDFLEQSGRMNTSYRKPSRPDILDLPYDNILLVTEDPRQKRGYKISSDTVLNIERKAENWLSK